MSARRFDTKFGATRIDDLPPAPGVYEWLGADDQTLYVGKAANLRSRLRQYRNAGRQKAHRKMRALVAAASELRVRTCDSELAALLLENQLIQQLRPPFNVSGAFAMLYPCIGVRAHERDLDLCCTTSPHLLGDVARYGAYRSARLTRAAFGALVELLAHVGHVEPARRLTDVPRIPYTRWVRVRQLEPRWRTAIEVFLAGTSPELLTQLVLALVEKPAARRQAEPTQAALQLLKHFWDEESAPLRQAMIAAGRGDDRFLPQAERDPLFLEVRAQGDRDDRDTTARPPGARGRRASARGRTRPARRRRGAWQ